MDFLILHLITMLGVNFHNKFFAVYLLIPGYAVFVGCKWAYNHVRNLDKEEPEEETPANQHPNMKKKKVEKVYAR
eukprot:CAMPEP_0170516104 /NCGR_PEP_ID=MMETSP0209-20121228/2432_1 /TAXON_ID=665100 ORGANISM="Litonotus pictus, Strain P1" /NCGR_SAMPLE_ID=MMETSP0209 /ASSEMBLY_ACC=CAM_ASM_000301 /LENGTH=74 /DNA_ID=CAMNT_0010800885 /DNA_START=221 /DNA_END=445 /DNA_ORIENTATION=+